MRPHKKRLPCVLLALICVNAAAQQPATPIDTKVETKPAPKVESIEVKSTQEVDARRDDTATKIVVTSAEINKFGDTQLADVLKRLPGITVQGTSIRMRGLGAGWTQILIDGERAPPDFTIDQLSPTMIERIEVIRAATAELSTQSIAGTINIILKKKISLAQREVRAVYTQSTFFKSPSANFVVSDKVGNFSYSVNGNVYQSRNIFPSDTTEVRFDAAGNLTVNRAASATADGSSRGFGIGPRLVWTHSNGDTLTWQSVVNVNHGGGLGTFRYTLLQGALPLANSADGRYVNKNDFARTDLNWIGKLDAGAKLDLKIGGSLNKVMFDNPIRSYNASNQQNLDRARLTTSEEKGFTFTGKYSTPMVEGHALMAGWDTGVSKREERATQLDQPIPNVLPVVPTFNSDDRFDAQVLKLAAFAQDEWNVSKQWSVYLGLRWESLTTTSEGNAYSAVKNRSSVWSPIAQTLYKLPNRNGEQLRLALTRTYKAPVTAQLVPRRFTSVDNRPTFPDSTGNPDLRPELATGIDVAAEKFWDQGASMTVSGSLRRITDYTRRGLLFINGRWVAMPINDGQAETRSLEFDTKLPIQKFYPSAPGIDFRFNASRNWSSVDSVPGPNNRLDAQIPFSATLGLDYRMKNGVVTAGGSYSFRSGGRVRTSINQESYQTTKRDLDVYALWKITPKTQVRLTLSNILRPLAVNESSYFDATGSTRTSQNNPSKPNIRLGLEMKL